MQRKRGELTAIGPRMGEMMPASADIVVATDIFGDSPNLRELLAGLYRGEEHVRIISPYAKITSFKSEEEAYDCFLRHGGIAPYAAKVLSHLADSGDEPSVCIGFSAGAAALWQVLADPASEGVRLAVCLYGSQIRQAIDVDPRCPCLLVFPEKEPHFSVEEVLGRLQGRENVCCTTVPWRHGYMNRLSRNFDQEGYKRTLDWLRWLLGRQDLAERGGEALNRLAGAAS